RHDALPFSVIKARHTRRAADQHILDRAIGIEGCTELYCRIAAASPRRNVINHAGSNASTDLGGIAVRTPTTTGLVTVSRAAGHAGCAQCTTTHGRSQSLAFGGVFLGFLFGSGLPGCFFLSLFLGGSLLFSFFLRLLLSSRLALSFLLGLAFRFFLSLTFSLFLSLAFSFFLGLALSFLLCLAFRFFLSLAF